jgi:hypothetical protein
VTTTSRGQEYCKSGSQLLLSDAEKNNITIIRNYKKQTDFRKKGARNHLHTHTKQGFPDIMFGTLFFDEARVNTAFRIRRTQRTLESTAACESAGLYAASVNRCGFSCRGEVALPSLRASLLWWLDAEASVVQLLVVNDSESSEAARACQSRLLSVEVPAQHPSALLTCGVTRNYMGDNGVAVVWVLCGDGGGGGGDNSDASDGLFPQQEQQNQPGTCLTAGFAQITVQREVDNTGHSSLLLVPDEQMVTCAPLTRIPGESFMAASSDCDIKGRGNACVVAELPEAATARTASLVVLTDGARLWRAELYCDGAVSVSEVADDYRRNLLRSFCEGNEEVRLLDTRTIAADLQRLSSPSSHEASALETSSTASSWTPWMRRFFGSSGAMRDDVAGDGDAANRFCDLRLPASVKRRLYTAVSAVQQSPFIAITRWNGQVEVYDVAHGALKLAPQYPIGILPQALLRPCAGDVTDRGQLKKKASQQNAPPDHLCALPQGKTVQWATRNPRTQLLHVVTCLAEDNEGRHPSLWTTLPPLPPATDLDGAVQGQAGELLAQYCTVSVAPPTLSSTPLACAVTCDGSRLVLVSNVGAEEDGHLLCSCSLGALTLHGARSLRQQHHLADRDGVATVVQVVEAEGEGGFHGLLRTSRLHGYLCQGVQLQGVVTCGEAVVMVEKGVQPCRLYTMEDAAADVLMEVTEGVVVGVEEEDVYGPVTDRIHSYNAETLVTTCGGDPHDPPRRAHYVPLIDAAPCVGTSMLLPLSTDQPGTTGDAFAVYWEGVNVIQACAHGARFMSELLRDVLLATTPVTEVVSLPRFLSEAHLSGYTASLQRSAPATQASVLAAVRLALSPSLPPSCRGGGRLASPPAFYKYSRLYVTQSAMSRLLARLTFLTTTYLGWQSTQSVAFGPSASFSNSTPAPIAAPSAEWFTQQIVTALEVLVAAYHAVPLAGSDMVRMAVVEDETTLPTSEAIIAALLPVTVPRPLSKYGGSNSSGCDKDSATSSNCELRATAIVQVVNRLRRCGTPRTARACIAWVRQLTHRFPLLQHYQLLSLLENAAASTQSARVQACCERVCQALAREAPADVASLLLLEGFLLVDVAGTGTGSLFRSLPLSEVVAFIAEDPVMGSKLYAVGVLRRVTGLGALYSSLSTTATRHYLYSMLMACDEFAERLQRRAAAGSAAAMAQSTPFQHLRRAFAELQVDVLLTAAQARVSQQADMAGCFHDLQTALDLITRHSCLATYEEVVQMVLGSVVEVACASQASMNALLRVTTFRAALQLEESFISKWYNYIARLPTISASEATESVRYRAIMGLHQYLMNRHSYGQCAQLMSNLATLLRCSPQRRSASAGISVSELAALALHAASMIAPSVPVPEDGRGGSGTAAAAASAASHSSSPTAAMAGSPLSLGYSWQPSSLSASPLPTDPSAAVVGGGGRAEKPVASNTRSLTRADIPWLQRRLYQAQCERQLWRRGCTLDCTDLWVEGAPVATYCVGVERLTRALMQTRLWTQAFRFACFSESYDPCTVLEEWAVDLLQAAQRSRSCALDMESAEAQQADRAAAWEELIGYCGELSTLENQFAAFVRTVTTALMYAYEDVPAELLAAHRMADAYTAMSTLFHVALMLRKRADATAEGSLRDNDGDQGGHQNGATSPSASSGSSQEGGDGMTTAKKCSAAMITATRRNVWRAFSEAARIALEILPNQGNPKGRLVYGQTRAEEEEAASASEWRAGSLLPVASPAASASRSLFSAFTAGLIDPMTVCATALLGTAAYKDVLPFVPGAQENINRFLSCVNAPST